jgi:hypothetical protein
MDNTIIDYSTENSVVLDKDLLEKVIEALSWFGRLGTMSAKNQQQKIQSVKQIQLKCRDILNEQD